MNKAFYTSKIITFVLILFYNNKHLLSRCFILFTVKEQRFFLQRIFYIQLSTYLLGIITGITSILISQILSKKAI